LPVDLALISILASFLQAKKPFIVAVPAVKSLVVRREPFVTRSGSNVLHLVQKVLLLLRKIRDLVAEDLEEKGQERTSAHLDSYASNEITLEPRLTLLIF
jgi:hypothetical protein